MDQQTQDSSIHLLHRLFNEGAAAASSDAQLAERFAKTRDPEAFSALVARHGPMVIAVCRAVVGPGGDAEDAFQATFLVLLNRIGTFPIGESLGGWLYRVARRVARQARVSSSRRRKREGAVERRTGSVAADAAEHTEIVSVIRQEVDLLPERYRAPIVLCDLQGLTRDEAAELLGCPAGTVGGRIVRGRRQLRDRLERRGVSPSATILVLPKLSAPAAVWRTSLDVATKAASLLANGLPATPGALSLASRSIRSVVPIKTAIALVVVACLAVGLIAARRVFHPPVVDASQAPAKPSTQPAIVPDPDDPKLAGRFIGRVTGPNGEPLTGARLFIVPQKSTAGTPGPVRAQTNADGRFDFDAPDLTYIGLDGLARRRTGLLFASADGFAPDGIVTWGATGSTFVSHYDPVKGGDLVLRLVRDDVPIQGRILDPKGQPIAGAKVRLSSLQVPRDHDLDAYLKKLSSPVKMFMSYDYERSLNRPELLPGIATETATDGDGRFKLTGFGNDRLASLIVTAPNMVLDGVEVMTRNAPDVVSDRDRDGNPSWAVYGANFTRKLTAAREIRGVVRDRETREPIAGMWVGPDAYWNVTHGNSLLQPTITDANGRFTFTGLDPRYPKKIQAWSTPGVPYMAAELVDDGRADFVFDCTRGVPFRLTLVDEAGAAVDASVKYHYVSPNLYLDDVLRGIVGEHPTSQAARRAKGVYEGFVIPGPGAVMVEEIGPVSYRSARVDPKAFFAPGKTDWTAQEEITAYGTRDTLMLGPLWYDQNDYAAIVLVNPPVGSKPLELTATLVRDRPRQVTLLDPEGQPLVRVQAEGLAPSSQNSSSTLRASTVPLTKLHPDRNRRITFVKPDRKLIGFLMARGDGPAAYTVRMQRWATVTGHLLDENGKALPPAQHPSFNQKPAILGTPASVTQHGHDDPTIGEFHDSTMETDGRFRIDRLVPGQRYTAKAYRGFGMDAGNAFEDVSLQSGEVRDLGDVRLKAPVDIRGK